MCGCTSATHACATPKGSSDAHGAGCTLMASTPPRWGDGVVPSYDAIAEQYAEQYFDELSGRPFDRDVLDRFAATVKDRGRVCVLGCGPGEIARYLAARGVAAFGIDASASMVATARRLNPTLQFRQCDPNGRVDASAVEEIEPPNPFPRFGEGAVGHQELVLAYTDGFGLADIVWTVAYDSTSLLVVARR